MRAFARHMTERMKAVAAAGAVAAFWLAVWAFAAALVAQPLILPGPGAVALALLHLVCDASTWTILVGSGLRIRGGLALAAVCGGVPVLRPIGTCLAGNRVEALSGIVNGSTNYLLTRMEQAGLSFPAALGEAKDLGGPAVFLASDAAAYIHGVVLPVDGGWLAR